MKYLVVAVLCLLALGYTYTSNSASTSTHYQQVSPGDPAPSEAQSGASHSEAASSTDPITTGALGIAKSGSAEPAAIKPGSKEAIRWAKSYEEAVKLAGKTGKPIMIDFMADWCSACKMLDAQFYPDSRVAAVAANSINVKVDIDKEPTLANRYQVVALPTIVWIDAKSKVLGRQRGLTTIDDFLDSMKTAHSKLSATSKSA